MGIRKAEADDKSREKVHEDKPHTRSELRYRSKNAHEDQLRTKTKTLVTRSSEGYTASGMDGRVNFADQTPLTTTGHSGSSSDRYLQVSREVDKPLRREKSHPIRKFTA